MSANQSIKRSNLISDVVFKSGDIGFSRSKGWLAKVILFMTSWITKDANVNHTFNFIGPELIVEALDKIRVNISSKYDSSIFEAVEVYRLPLSNEDRLNFRLGLLRKINGSYGWFKLPLFALDAVSTKITSLFGRKIPIFFFTKTFGILNIPVCSQLSVYALHKFTSYFLRDKDGKQVNWRIVSPDYLEDLSKLSHNGIYLVYKK